MPHPCFRSQLLLPRLMQSAAKRTSFDCTFAQLGQGWDRMALTCRLCRLALLVVMGADGRHRTICTMGLAVAAARQLTQVIRLRPQCAHLQEDTHCLACQVMYFARWLKSSSRLTRLRSQP